MIAINCTHCQQRLEMDEAFAGGVCRCQHCGTIQTVPSHLKKTAAATAAGNGAKTAPAGAAGHAGSGLDELADVVASSGLARSSLARTSRTAPQRRAPAAASAEYAAPGEPAPARSPLMPVLLGAGVVVVVLLGVILYLVFVRDTSQPVANGGKGPSATPGGTGVVEPAEPTLTIAGPAYADVPLAEAQSVVYVLDRSQANAEVLDMLKASIYYSVETLGPGRKFQILFWSHKEEDEIIGYPADGLAPATPAEIQAAARAFDEVISYGNTELGPSLERAVASRPDVIVIATAKGLSLEEDTLAAVDAAVGGTAIKVHTFALGETESPVLKQIAERTGGRYREISHLQLKRLRYLVPQRR